MRIEHRFRVMNTNALVIVCARDAGAATRKRIEDAEAYAHATEQRFSRFMPDSELCRMNAAAGTWIEVSPEMAEVLELAYGLHAQTDGLFDPAILADLERAGYDRSFETLPEQRDPAPRGPRRTVRFGDIELERGRVRLPTGVRVDLGGIVKGWTADRLAALLADVGPTLVELGGDVAVTEAPSDGDGWEVGVRSPGSERIIGVVHVASGGVATSGIDARRWRSGADWAHHIIDPRTGEPSRSALVQVTAFAADATFAEVWAKAALIGGADESAKMLDRHPELRLVLWRDGGEPVASRGIPFMYGPPVLA